MTNSWDTHILFHVYPPTPDNLLPIKKSQIAWVCLSSLGCLNMLMTQRSSQQTRTPFSKIISSSCLLGAICLQI